MTTYTIDDIRGPTMAREMAALKDFVLSRFNECLSDATTAAAAAATAAANAVISSITSRVTALETADAQNVKLTGAQTVAGVKTFSSSPVVPTVATGTNDTKAANGTKVQNELDAYSAMVRTANAQTIAGVKTFTSQIINTKNNNSTVNYTAIRADVASLSVLGKYITFFNVLAADSSTIMALEARTENDGTTSLYTHVKNSDGTTKYVQLAKGDVI